MDNKFAQSYFTFHEIGVSIFGIFTVTKEKREGEKEAKRKERTRELRGRHERFRPSILTKC